MRRTVSLLLVVALGSACTPEAEPPPDVIVSAEAVRERAVDDRAWRDAFSRARGGAHRGLQRLAPEREPRGRCIHGRALRHDVGWDLGQVEFRELSRARRGLTHQRGTHRLCGGIQTRRCRFSLSLWALYTHEGNENGMDSEARS